MNIVGVNNKFTYAGTDAAATAASLQYNHAIVYSYALYRYTTVDYTVRT
jgi:hypothetical protein